MVSDRENEFQISAVSHLYLLAFFGLKKIFRYDLKFNPRN